MGKYINANYGNTSGKYVKQGNVPQSTSDIQQQSKFVPKGTVNIMLNKQMEKEVLSHVTIPQYFYNVILPQMGSYYDVYPVDFDNKPVVCCPLHDEDTPSCRYYEETNTFYCFGCQQGGNVIRLHRLFAERMNGRAVQYNEAVNFLYDYFIRGKEQVGYIDTNANKLDKSIEKSTDVDLVRFNVYRENLEKSITHDRNINLHVKKQVWSLLDNIDVLVSKNEIGANEAKLYIQNFIQQVIR